MNMTHRDWSRDPPPGAQAGDAWFRTSRTVDLLRVARAGKPGHRTMKDLQAAIGPSDKVFRAMVGRGKPDGWAEEFMGLCAYYCGSAHGDACTDPNVTTDEEAHEIVFERDR